MIGLVKHWSILVKRWIILVKRSDLLVMLVKPSHFPLNLYFLSPVPILISISYVPLFYQLVFLSPQPLYLSCALSFISPPPNFHFFLKPTSLSFLFWTYETFNYSPFSRLLQSWWREVLKVLCFPLSMGLNSNESLIMSYNF